MDDLLNASDSAVTSFLYRRTGAICTMCGEVMAEGAMRGEAMGEEAMGGGAKKEF